MINKNFKQFKKSAFFLEMLYSRRNLLLNKIYNNINNVDERTLKKFKIMIQNEIRINM